MKGKNVQLCDPKHANHTLHAIIYCWPSNKQLLLLLAKAQGMAMLCNHYPGHRRQYPDDKLSSETQHIKL